MAVLNLRVSVLVILVLLLVVLLSRVCVASSSKNLKLGQKGKVINRLCHIRRCVATAARIVGVNVHRLHDSTQVAWERGHQGSRNRGCCGCGARIVVIGICTTKNIVPKVTTLPTARVRVGAMVHVEPLLTASRIVVIMAIHQTNISTTTQCRLKCTEGNSGALTRTIVVKAKDVHIISSIDCLCSDVPLTVTALRSPIAQ